METEMKNDEQFSSISTLCKTMLKDNTLRVIHSHRVWTASFTWATPLSEKEVKDVEIQLGKEIPKDVFFFLTSISNGAFLFRNIDDAMTGYKIFSIDEFIEKQAIWKQSLKGLWMPNFLVIGEIVFDDRPIIMDLNIPTIDGRSCMLFEGNPNDPVKYWVKISQSFYEWIDHLITAQGAPYWLWT